MKFSIFLSNSFSNLWKSLVLLIFLIPINVANATSTIVKVEDMGLADWTIIEKEAPGFGSNGPVSLDWDPYNDWFRELIVFNDGYSGKGAAFCWHGENCALKLSVTEENTTLMLESFFLGFYGSGEGNVEFSVFDLETDTNILAGTPLVTGNDGLDIFVNAVSSVGFLILFGPDGYSIGINEIAYSYQSSNIIVHPVPIPAASWLFVSGLIGLLCFTRRNSRET
ncbi:hypothetical protein [Methylotuvimicrobium sp. KM1]|uniref:hypothetical protein n=1 Tax=Methylotuvimicrobium sp. KM1 TaxID=3377707 RepID=UPI00384FE30F